MSEELQIVIKAITGDTNKKLKEVQNELENTGKKSGALSKIGSVMGNVGKAIAGVAVTAVVSSATAVASLTKAATTNYAEYEQLVGGVDTLFKGSSQKVQAYANEAYKTAGMSANQYMSTVTGFSASLLQSLGGDTNAAADAANQAVIDMSDNANKMGTSIESIQNAYQGFAKQNYTMLDNLKLGYGGTKSEMERLLSDAEKISGVHYDISNLNDVYSAIHVIQGQLGITGTTAKEASTTIEGSVNSAKAAYSNMLTGLATDTGNFDVYINNFVDSITTVGENIIPVVQNIAAKIPQLIQQIVPKLLSLIGQLSATLIPTILQVATQIIQVITQLIPQIIATIVQMIPPIVQGIVAMAPALLNGILQLIIALCTQFSAIIQPIIQALPQLIMSIVEALIQNLPALIDGVIQLILGIVNSIGMIIELLVPMIPQIVFALVNAIIDSIPAILMGCAQVCRAILGLEGTLIKALIQYYVNLFKGMISFYAQLPGRIWEIIKIIPSYFATLYADIINIFVHIGDWFGNIFRGAFNKIKSAFSGITGFFSGVFNSIKSIFSNVGTAIAGGISGAVKGAVNSVLSFATRTINSFISAINVAISVINAIPGVKIKKLNQLSTPRLAKGGIVDSATLAVVGEQGKEAVMPLENNTEWIDMLAARLNQNKNNNAKPTPIILQVDGKTFAQTSINSINELTKQTGSIGLNIM